jgi:ankyrin repeat protein
MSSILPLIFSLIALVACGKHSQVSRGISGVSNAQEINTEALLQHVLEENLSALEKYAIENGDLETELSTGRTLLTEACQWGKLKVIVFLVSKKVDLTKRDRLGKSALHYADEDNAIKRALFPQLVIELKRSLFRAVSQNQLNELKKVLEENPPVNFLLESQELGEETQPFEGETLLTFIVKRKLENILRFLAQPKYGLDPNIKNNRGESPLRLARDLQYTNIQKLLIKLGASENE